MANEMPDPEDYSGLSRTVLRYGAAFAALVEKRKAGPLTAEDWAPIEEIVDVDRFEREGVWTAAKTEKFGWQTYKTALSDYASDTAWEGTVRHITETPGRVILELEERNTSQGHLSVANTVTVYEFSDAGRLRHLEVYVMQKA